MKAKLLVSIEGIYEFSSELELELVIPEVRSKVLYSKEVDDSDYDKFLTELDGVINESTIWKNALGGIGLIIGKSVYEFIEGREDDIEKYIRQLLVEM